jgi:hypothetical protein
MMKAFLPRKAVASSIMAQIRRTGFEISKMQGQ